MSKSLFDIGSVVTDVFTFLDPQSQQSLRGTEKKATQWFDTAATNGVLPFFSHSGVAGTSWKYSPVHPKAEGVPDTVTANVRNYYFSTMNIASQVNEFVQAPVLNAADEAEAEDITVHSFILQGFRCRKLTVTGLDGILTIEKRFLEKCTAEEITFEGANQLKSVSMHWMLRCPNLKKVTFAGAMPKLTTVGNCWLMDCQKLEAVDFTGLTALQHVADRWLFTCPSLKTVDFTPFAGTLEEIGCCFLGHAFKIDNLAAKLDVLSKVTKVHTVGQYAPPEYRAFSIGKEVPLDEE